MGLFVLEAGMPGFTKGRKLEKLGRLAQDTAELFMDDVAVPSTRCLRAWKRTALPHGQPCQERLSIAITAVASAEKRSRSRSVRP